VTRTPRRNHSSAFEAKVALDAIRGDKTMAELAQLHDVHPNQITDWKHQLLKGAANVFGAETAGPANDLMICTPRWASSHWRLISCAARSPGPAC
jgi:transposase-like protein